MHHLPANTETTVPCRDYPAYRPLPEELSRLLESLQVSDVTSIYYVCGNNYRMMPRRIGDDMFYYVVQGEGEVHIEDRVSRVRAGHAVHFPRSVQHAAYANPRDPFHVVALHYNATVFESLTLPQLLHFPDVVDVGTDGAFRELANIACREYALNPPGWERGLDAITLRLLLFYIRQFLPLEDMVKTARWREVRRVLPALEIMRRHLSRAIPVEELAAACHLSAPQFRRVFSQAMNASPNEYLRRRRMEEAALLLKRTEQTIETIAQQVGYADPSFFAHSFKATMGTSPGKYRTLSAV